MKTQELILRNPNLAPLGIEQLKRMVPAVFATQPDENVSTRYGFASTSQVLQALEKEGFVPCEARWFTRRDPGALQFTKHMVKLRKQGDVNKLRVVGDVIPQIVLINSHDRSSTFQLNAGMHRLVCANGLIVSDKQFVDPVHVRHTNRIIEDLMANVQRISADVGKVCGAIESMTKVKLTDRQQSAFAVKALELRFGNGTGRGSVDPKALLVPRRDADKGNDVWRVYNRVQENMIKGGIASVTAANRNTFTREVVSINADMHINAGLWELAMAAIDKAKRK